MIWDWLLAPVDPARAHDVGVAMSWHARVMVLGWGILAPLSVLVARYFKVLPGQDWPNDLDSKVWWRCHWISQAGVLCLSLLGLALILASHQNTGQAWGHRLLGYLVVALGLSQGLSGLLRGSKGGPTDPRADGSWAGDHYDMSTHRLLFERFHKSCGYLTLSLAVPTILTGLWTANGPNWMWAFLLSWWTALLILATVLQKTGHAVDTYQAIWGPDPVHPGNRMKPQGWATIRPALSSKSKAKQRKT